MSCQSDRRILHTEFVLQAVTRRTFTVNAYANDDGSNAQCQRYNSISNSFLTSDLVNSYIWMNCPCNQWHAFIQHYVQRKAASPKTISACIIVFAGQDTTWKPLLKGMHLSCTYPKGPLLSTPPNNEGGRTPRKGTPWLTEIDNLPGDLPQPPNMHAKPAQKSGQPGQR